MPLEVIPGAVPRDASETAGPAFVPHLAVTVAVLLTVLSLAVFIYFIHHTANSIQIATILARISEDLEKLIQKLYPETTAHEETLLEKDPPSLPKVLEAITFKAVQSGYLQAVDERGLLAFAKKHQVLVKSLHLPGTFVIEGRPVAYLWADEGLEAKAAERLRTNFTFGSRRTPVQDLNFVFEQLTEVALRALSPGINDPITAMRCVDRIGQGLSQLATRKQPSAFRFDEEGKLRLVLPEFDIETLVANTLGGLRQVILG